MTVLEEKTCSFIVKIWFEEDSHLDKPTWRGHITHIPSRKRAYFNSYEGIVQFIDQSIKGFDSQLDSSNE